MLSRKSLFSVVALRHENFTR